MSTPLFQSATLLATGFILGLGHAFDADHVAAVSTIVSKTKSLKKSSLFGAIWGAGHTTTLFITGLAILFFKISIPPQIAQLFEFLVGVMLVIMGLDLIIATIKNRPHEHQHQHGDEMHIHTHDHSDDTHRHHKSFIIGMVHGLAGSAALMLLVLSTVESMFTGLLFILIFGIGSIIGMLLASTLIGLPFILMNRFDKIHRLLAVVSGFASLFIGGVIIYQIGVMGHLLY